MYLWDANILRHFAEGNPILKAHLERIDWPQIALPSVVVAEVLRGRCEFALKATPTQAPQAHQRLLDTMAMLQAFDIVPFDEECARLVLDIQKKRQYPKTLRRCDDCRDCDCQGQNSRHTQSATFHR